MIVAAGMGVVWVLDSQANWSVQRRARQAGQDLDLPPARNLFTQDPEHWSATLLAAFTAEAAPAHRDSAR
jgi:hypothetical protein